MWGFLMFLHNSGDEYNEYEVDAGFWSRYYWVKFNSLKCGMVASCLMLYSWLQLTSDWWAQADHSQKDCWQNWRKCFQCLLLIENPADVNLKEGVKQRNRREAWEGDLALRWWDVKHICRVEKKHMWEWVSLAKNKKNGGSCFSIFSLLSV